MGKKRVYPDTHIALHYKRFDQIDWLALVNADEVTLVLSPVFFQEIDEKKNSVNRLLKSRAREFGTWLKNAKQAPIRPGVRIEIEHEQPELDVDFDTHRLLRTNNDDQIVACLLRAVNAHPDEPPVCVTTDSTLINKLEARKLAYVEPSENDRLPEAPDEIERENRELRKQLAEKTKAEPSLDVSFGNAKHTTVLLSPLTPVSESDAGRFRRAEAHAVSMATNSILHRFVPPKDDSPEREERHAEAAAKWLREYSDFAIARSLTFSVEILLSNDGRAPAREIDVDVAVPQHVFVSAYERDLTIRRRPRFPGTPHHLRMMGERLAEMSSPVEHLRMPPDVPASDPVGGISLHQRGPHAVQFRVDGLKHENVLELLPLTLWFGAVGDISGFELACRIHAANLPKPQTTNLHIVIKAEPAHSAPLPDDDAH